MSSKRISLRDKILETSRHILYSEGHKALSMRVIAKEVGVSATSIYLHFKNKDHLMHTLIEESVEELSDHIEEKVRQKTTMLERFEACINAYIEFGLQNPEKYLIIYNVKPEAMARYPKEKFRKVRRSYELLAGIIEEGVAEGVMDVDDPKLAAYSIWAQMHGVVSVVLNQRLDSRIDQKVFISESLEHIVQGFLIRTTVS